MNDLQKSLTDLIDETLLEIEELKKSRFSAAEIEIKGPGENLAGKPTNGKLDAAKAEDDKKDEEESEEEAEKADKEDDKKEDKKDDDKDEEGSDKHEDAEKKAIKNLASMHDMKKSLENTESLMKSYIDSRVAPLESKLTSIFDLVAKMADQPVAPRGVSSRVAVLAKSADVEVQPLSKAQVADKLFELKKSGTPVDSLDVTKAEMGQDLGQIVSKYKLS